VGFDPAQFEVRQVFFTSRDGARIPMFLAGRRGCQQDGTIRRCVYATRVQHLDTPTFSVSLSGLDGDGAGCWPWPTWRVEGRYGEDWHQAARAASQAECCSTISSRRARMVICRENTHGRHGWRSRGAATGWLLSEPPMTQFVPSCVGACLPASGVMECCSYHRFTASLLSMSTARSTIGAVSKSARLLALPTTCARGTRFPATLISTADTDDRVVPDAQFQVCRRAAARAGGRSARADPDRNPRRPRRGVTPTKKRDRKTWPTTGRFSSTCSR